MPNYDLQFKTQTGTVECGRVLVSMAGGSVSINFRPQGQGGNGVAIPNATYTAAGGGTATSPSPGDLLNLAGYQVTVGATQCRFNGNAVFQNAQGSQRKGYYRANKLTEDQGDWDAADSGGPLKP
jgi:hypothetical protein